MHLISEAWARSAPWSSSPSPWWQVITFTKASPEAARRPLATAASLLACRSAGVPAQRLRRRRPARRRASAMRRPASARADDGPGFHARALDAHRLGRRGAGGARTNDRRQGRVRLQFSPRRRRGAAYGGISRRRAEGSPRVPAGARSPVGAGVAGRRGTGLELRAGIYCFGIFALSKIGRASCRERV